MPGIPKNGDAAPTRRKISSRATSWTQDPEGVRKDILEAARIEFAEKGLSGARVDEIATRIATSKRMIFYYFKDKEGLYIAVLEEAYARIRGIERSLDLATSPPREALELLVGFTFNYHARHPEFVRLVMGENIHHARHMKLSAKIGELNLSAIDTVRDIYMRGLEQDVFREGLSPLDIHLTITALSFYNVSNRASILQAFGHDMADKDAQTRRCASVVETVLRLVSK